MGKYRVHTDGGTFEVTTDEPDEKPAPAAPSSAMQRFGSGAYDSTVGAVGNALQHPLDTAVGIAKSAIPHLPSPEQVSSAYGHLTTPGERGKLVGDYKDVVMGHPMVAPAVPIAQDAQQGNYAGAAGRAVGIGAMAAAPKALGSAGRALGIPEATAPLRRVLSSPDVLEKTANTVVPFANIGTKARGLGSAVGEAWNGQRTPPPPPIAKPTPAPPVRWNQVSPEGPPVKQVPPPPLRWDKPDPVSEPPVKQVAPPPIRWDKQPAPVPPVKQVAPPAIRWNNPSQPPTTTANSPVSSPVSGPPQDILEGIARSQTGKSFAKLSPDQQATVSKLASTVPPTPEAPVISQPKTANPLPIVSSQQVAQMMADEMLSNKSITPEMVNKEIPPPPTPSPAAPSNIRNRRVK